MARILIAEDDPGLRALLSEILQSAGHVVHAVADGLAALAALDTADLVLTDLQMPGADGMTVLRAATARAAPPPVIMLTAFGSVQTAVNAMRAGAYDFMTKPLQDPDALREVVRQALAAKPSPTTRPDDSAIVQADPATASLFNTLRLVAARDTTVLLTGESGVGKEVAARYVHDQSPRRDGPFIAVNCGAIPIELFESQLFGHVRGAFTGAHAHRAGLFEEANGGTLLLDEVGELTQDAQVKLLRVLEARRFTPVGESRSRAANVRIIAATLRDLEADMRGGRFRQDLYYRLSVFPICVPALRARPGDILPLAQAALQGLGERTTIGIAAARALTAYDWPGNARELRNVMERAAILANGRPIDVEHLGLSTTTPAPQASAPGADTLKDMERTAIVEALAAEGGNRRRAAKRLGVALRTLQYKLKRYELS